MPHTTPPVVWLRAVLALKAVASRHGADHVRHANGAQILAHPHLAKYP